MKKHIKLIIIMAAALAAGGCRYDDSELKGRVDDFKNRIEALKGSIEQMNEQLAGLNTLTGGNVITSVIKDSDGNYVITYLDGSDNEKSVVIATASQMINVPVLGVQLDPDSQIYYWTVTDTDGNTAFLLVDGEKVPVSGHAPVISVDADGYWTADGEILKDSKGNPIEAKDGETCVFRSVEINSDGNLEIVLGNGKTITLPVQNVFNLTLSAVADNTVANASVPVVIDYEMTGSNAEGAIVAIAKAEGLDASLDREKKTVTVTFPDGFTSGMLIMVAYDLADHTVIRPLFFNKAVTDRIEIHNAEELVAFAEAVNSQNGTEQMKAYLMNDIDMSSVEKWTPIGMPETVSNGNTATGYTGAAFKGEFNGNGHAIKNIVLSAKLPDASTYGLFGVIDGALVENLVLGTEGDKSVFSVSAAGTADAGVLAGTVINSSISNVTNNIKIEVLGSDVNKRFAVGIVGFLCSTATGASVSSMTNVVNNAPIDADAGACTAAGAASVMVGGIVGFSTGTDNSHINMIESCVNKGDIKSHVGRSSGIVATANTRTFLRYCSNFGNQFNDFTNSRIGNISCVVGTKVSLDDCFNYGDLTTADAQSTCAGLVALLNADNVTISSGGNYGTIIGANNKFHGLLVANFSKFAMVTGCMAAGACGDWSADGNHSMHALTAENFMSHIGWYSLTNLSKIIDIHSPFGSGGGELEKVELADGALRILCIGNSFTKDAVEHLPGMMAAAGTDNVVIAHCYFGGRTVPEYTAGWTAAMDYTLYYCAPGADSWTTPLSRKVSIKEVAESGRWDVVTIQEHTGNKAAWVWDATEKDAITGLVDYVKATQQNVPKFWYIMSQAYWNMGKIGSGSKPYMTWTDQKGMYDVIVDQAKKVMEETPMDGIIATGTYFQNLRTSKVNVDNGMDLTRDGYHMDYGISRYGAACTVFETLITPFNGKTLDGNSYRYGVSSTSDSGYSTPVTSENIPFAIAAARYAIEKPWEITDMSSFGESVPGGGIGDIDYVEGGKE